MIGNEEHPFERYLDTEKALDQISRMMQNESYPFTINLLDYWDTSEVGAKRLIRNGYKELPILKSILRGRLAKESDPRIVIENYIEQTRLRDVNHNHIGQIVCTTAIVTSIAEPAIVLTTALYRCEVCNWTTTLKVKGQFMPPTPKCEECGLPTAVDPMGGEMKTVQWLSLQEVFEDTPPNSTPITMKSVLNEGILNSANPGERVFLISVVRGMQKRKNDANPDVDLYLEVNGLKAERDSNAEINLTDADRQQLKQIASDPDYIAKLTRSIAPSLHDLDKEKLSLALQQCGGNIIDIGDEHKRGSIHILMAGDPAQGKSKLLEWATAINPRGIKTVGPGSTAAGLTASTIRDEETGKYTLVAGAMVLADGAIVGADEFDKMRKEDRGAIHDAMEEQVVHVNKGGFNANLRSRCAVLAACNPYGGQWNTSQTLLENIKHFPPALISRFDLIWILTNDRTVKEEMTRVDHVLKNRFHTGEDHPPISEETLKKLFAYAKTFKPKVNMDAETKIRNFYEYAFSAGRISGSTMMTMRMIEGIARLTEASAKLHLREVATKEDADLIIELVRTSLLQSGVDPATGKVDMNVFETGISNNLREKMDLYLDTVKKIRDMSIDHLAREEDVEATLVAKGFTSEEVRKIQGVLMRDGLIYSPRPRLLSIT
jgi:replicative DNA helicase Mcm